MYALWPSRSCVYGSSQVIGPGGGSMKWVGVVTGVVAAVALAHVAAPAASVAGTAGQPPPDSGNSTTVPTSSTVFVSTASTTAALTASTAGPPTPVPNPDNDHLFTVGEIEIPQGGEAGEVSMVVANAIDPGHLLLIVRNNRDV